MKPLSVRFNEPKVSVGIEKVMAYSPEANKSDIARAAMNIGLSMLEVAGESMTKKELSRYIESEQ